ncbi:MAG: type II toxin-antitoxin system Phd/YefM family antitoxin [Betaproteobacteria bacterium]|nr:MAG: type II toxin-antitoxin system Phd/YefM family antitoxin [Betaproteobacteria bacterium]
MATWQLQEAKAKFSEIVKLAAHEPQEVTVHGESRVVVIAASEYKRLKNVKRQLPLGDFLMNSPLAGLDLDFSRDQGLPRDISLD